MCLYRIVDFSQNGLENVGAIFDGFAATQSVTVLLSGNRLDEVDLTTALSSFQSSVAALTLDVSNNSIAGLPPYMLTNISTKVSTYGDITILMRQNPITYISESAFTTSSDSPAFLREVYIDLSSPTAILMNAPTTFTFSNISWDTESASSLTINAAYTNVSLGIVQLLGQAFNSATAPPTLGLHVNLSHNHYTEIPPNTFNVSMLQSVDFSSNNLTMLGNMSFGNASASNLNAIYLSHNNISTMEETLFHNVTSLRTIDLSFNSLTKLDLGVCLHCKSSASFELN